MEALQGNGEVPGIGVAGLLPFGHQVVEHLLEAGPGRDGEQLRHDPAVGAVRVRVSAEFGLIAVHPVGCFLQPGWIEVFRPGLLQSIEENRNRIFYRYRRGGGSEVKQCVFKGRWFPWGTRGGSRGEPGWYRWGTRVVPVGNQGWFPWGTTQREDFEELEAEGRGPGACSSAAQDQAAAAEAVQGGKHVWAAASGCFGEVA